MALYSFFGLKGIGTNDTSVQVCEKKFYFDDITKNNCFLSDLKMPVGHVPGGEFF